MPDGIAWSLLTPIIAFSTGTAWARALHKTYGHQPVYTCFSDDTGATLALVPMMDVRSALTGRRGICLPFTDYCTPLLFSEDGLALALDSLHQLALERNWKYFEVRGKGMFEATDTPAKAFYRHTLDLRGSEDNLLAQFKGSARGAIRKAQRSGVTIEVTQTREALLEFFRLHVATRRRHGLPPQPLSFFSNIYREVIQSGYGFVVVATAQDRAIAAAVFFHFEKAAVYKFSASDEQFRELQANNLNIWEAIRFLRQSGVEILDFGRTSLSNEGLRRFKLSWGTEEQTIDYLQFDTRAGRWIRNPESAPGVHSEVFRRLPLALNRLAGTLIYPHLD